MAQKTAYLSTITAELPVTIDKDKKTLFDPLYFWFLAIFLLAITALAIAWRAFSQRQAKNLYLAANGDFDPLKTGIFDQSAVIGYQDNLSKVDFSLTQNGLSESMSVVDLSEVHGLDYQEEGEMILEQARIYVNIGRLEEATDLLKAQIKTMPQASLHHWLYLLDIYREHQQKNEFLQYAKQLHETFNVMMPLWDNAALPMVIASSLEEFPHIVNNLTGLWANPDPLTDAQIYIEELLMDNRASERAGFSMEVFQELVTLRDLVTVRAKMAVSE
jgi:tetratricopeptide (TPR) repeat protein